MPHVNNLESAQGWKSVAPGDFGLLFTSVAGTAATRPTARQVIVGGAGDLYLIPVGGAAGVGVLFFPGAVAGQTFTVQCDGIGSSTGAGITSVTALF